MAAPIETKVKAGTLAAAVAGFADWLLGRYVFHGTVPAGYAAEVYAAVPLVLTFAAGWFAPHTHLPAAPAAMSLETAWKLASPPAPPLKVRSADPRPAP